MRRLLVALGCLGGLALSTAQAAGPDSEGKPFVRLVRDGKRVVALETAVVRYVPQDCGKTSPSVDLIAAIHIADKSYYSEINRLFKQYEVVLYELVAPEGTRVPKGGGKNSHPVASLQHFMSQQLNLQHQLQGVDYSAKNLVHADMTPDQFARSMERKGESAWTVMFRMMGYAMARQNDEGGGDMRMLMALFDQDRALSLKRIMAEQFEDLEGAMGAIEGNEGSTLIAERNKVALAVLRKQLDSGKKNVAVFYGGGHMADFHKRLADDFNLTPTTRRWLPAWNMRAKP